MNDTTLTEGNSVVIFCILPAGCSEATCPAKLHKVFEVCTLKRFNVKWIREEDCLSHRFSKTDVLVFNEFEGEVYKQVAKTARSVFGPPCILACLELDQPLPLVNNPCYTAGMKDLDICTSSFENPKKEELFRKIALMSGRYSSQMTTNVTHLVTDKVGSLKYKAAVRNGTPVMSSSWVDAVWERSKNEAVHAIHSDFRLYTTPIFGGLTVTCSNMSRLEKEELRTKIEANGGTFSGSLEYKVTDILFLTKPTGDKFKFAASWKLPILRPDWVYASLEKGYAVPYSDYEVHREEKSSTPVNKHNNATLIEANASMCSTIAGENDQSRRFLNETATTNSSIASDSTAKKTNEYGLIIEKLNLAELRRLGPFLDGLKVYLSGFDSDQAEKLRRIINASGATRFTTLTDTVSHIIAGAHVDADKNEWEKLGRKSLVVSVKWLLASSERGKPAPETDYDVSEWSSHSVVQRRSVGNNKENSDEADPTLLSIVKQYTGHVPDIQTTPIAAPVVTPKVDNNNARASSSKGSEKAVERESGEMTYTQSEYEPVFEGHKFLLTDLEPEEKEDVQCLVENRQGVIDPVDFTYQVVPIDYKRRITREMVTVAWISDCCDASQIVPVQFYHRPLPTVPDSCANVLKDVVLTVSGFSTGTKRYLESLASVLGAEVQITFSKKNLPQQGLKASTHLCCALPEGKKYEAAIKWKIPAVSPRWLQECLRRQKSAPVEDFPVESPTDACTLDDSALPSPATNGATRIVQPCLSSPALRVLNAPLPFQVTTPETPSFLDARKRKALAEFINDLDIPTRPSDSPPKKQRITNDTLEAFQELAKAGATLRSRIPVSQLETRVQSSSNGPQPGVSQAGTRPFQGEKITVYVSKKIPNEAKLQEIVISLGGNVSYVHDDSVTHVILKAKTNQAKEVKLAKDYQQFAVHPDWLYACKEGLARIPEELYPFNLDPKMSLAVSPIPSQRAALDKPHSTKSKPGSKIVESASQLRNDDANDSMEIAEPCDVPSTDTQECLQQLELLEQVLSESKNRPNTRTIQRRSSDVPAAFIFEKNDVPESQMKHPDSLESQAAAVTWADPRESTHRAIMEKQRQMEAGDVPVTNSENNSGSSSGSKSGSVVLKPAPVIIFSGLKPDEKNRYTSLVKTLGGRVSESANYDPATTHLVTPMLGRNEKQLGCIAAGKWVLRLEWLEECESCGRFVAEEKYEWGTLVCETNFDRSGITDMSMSLARASYVWRDARRSCVVGRLTPYQGLTVILHAADKKDAFTRLVEAGGGRIVIAEPPYSDPNDASVVLDDSSDPSKVDYGALARMGIACIKPNALHDLLNSPDPPPLQKVASSNFAAYIQFFNYAASEKRLGWSWAN